MVRPWDWPEGGELPDPQVRDMGPLLQEASQLCPCLSLGPHHLTFPVPVPESPVAYVTNPLPSWVPGLLSPAPGPKPGHTPPAYLYSVAPRANLA